MDWLPQWLLINVVSLALIFFLAWKMRNANARKVEAMAARLRPEASARGWQVTSEYVNQTRTIRWTGRDFDVQWVGEDVHRKRGQRSNTNVLEVTRWKTVGTRGPSGAIFLMGLPEGTQVPKAQAVDGFLQSMAVKAAMFALDKGIDMYFGADIGKAIDAQKLERVEQVEPVFDGYAVFAENSHEAASLIRNSGIDKAVAAAIDGGPESMKGYRRPWILIWKGGVAISKIGSTRSAAELEPILKAGLALTRATASRV